MWNTCLKTCYVNKPLLNLITVFIKCACPVFQDWRDSHSQSIQSMFLLPSSTVGNTIIIKLKHIKDKLPDFVIVAKSAIKSTYSPHFTYWCFETQLWRKFWIFRHYNNILVYMKPHQQLQVKRISKLVVLYAVVCIVLK